VCVCVCVCVCARARACVRACKSLTARQLKLCIDTNIHNPLKFNKMLQVISINICLQKSTYTS